MWPNAILDELQAERDRVGEVIAEANRAMASTWCSAEDLRERVLAIRFALISYTDIEDDLMPEVLRTLDEWGAEQREEMGREHLRRRGAIAQALATLDSLPHVASEETTRATAGLLAQLNADVLSSLAEEDRLFRGAVSRNDANRFNGFGG